MTIWTGRAALWGAGADAATWTGKPATVTETSRSGGPAAADVGPPNGGAVRGRRAAAAILGETDAGGAALDGAGAEAEAARAGTALERVAAAAGGLAAAAVCGIGRAADGDVSGK